MSDLAGGEDFVKLLRKTGTRYMPQHRGRPRGGGILSSTT